jgi:AcrR family transcriptional regulator
MPRSPTRPPRRDDVLTRERIVDAAVALLDEGGEAGLTFRVLAERLATGAGAIYWHVDNKGDLLTAASDAVVTRALQQGAQAASPRDAVRAVALALFDAIDAHAWVGAALIRAAGRMPMVRILEALGQPLVALGVAEGERWPAVSALLHFILGVAGQNAANSHVARTHEVDRTAFLSAVADRWLELDAAEFPFTRGMAAYLREHDDRADFLAGVDLILDGLHPA